MSTKKLIALHPSYYNKFSCIGGDCEESCCTLAWGIDVDKNSYMLYRKNTDPEFAALFDKHIKRHKDDAVTKLRYAKIVNEGRWDCPFLTEERLCMMQKNYGPYYLCVTCQVYPRIHGRVRADLHELSISTSCPEAVRAALFSEEPMGFEISEFTFDERHSLFKSGLGTVPKGAGGALNPFAWEIREACIDLLQCRRLPLPSRLLAVGLLLQKLDAMEKAGEAEKAADTAAAYARMAEAGEFDTLSQSFSDSEALRAVMASNLLRYALFTAKLDKGGRVWSHQPLHTFVSTLEAHVPEGEEQTLGKLYGFVSSCVEEFWPLFLLKRGHVLENYFVNLVFSRRYPFLYEELSLYQHFIILATQYALIRTLLCVNARVLGSITEELLTQVLSVLSVDSLHGTNALDIAKSYRLKRENLEAMPKNLAALLLVTTNNLEEAQNDDLAHISFLLRE